MNDMKKKLAYLVCFDKSVPPAKKTPQAANVLE